MYKIFLLIAMLFISINSQAYVFTNGVNHYYFSQSELKCLYDNVYHEARSESKKGQELVVTVTLTRLFDRRWNNTVCGVVYQGVVDWKYHREEYIKCAFSWACDRKSDDIKEPKAYQQVKINVNNYLKGLAKKTDYRYTPNLYHRNDVSPWWAKSNSVKYVLTSGVHIFYRE